MLRHMDPRTRPSPPSHHEAEQRRTGRLDRQTILDTAREIADTDGLRALTLRRLGRELGVDSTAMYRHFRDKAELFSALVDQLFVAVPEPNPNGTWRENLRNLMISWWRIYRDHEGLSEVMARQPDDEPRLFHLTEWTVRELLRAGVPANEIGLFHQAIYNHTVGSGLVAAFSPWLTTPEIRDEQKRIYATLDPVQFPSAALAAKSLYPETEEAYLFSVDLLLDAIEARAARDGTPQNHHADAADRTGHSSVT